MVSIKRFGLLMMRPERRGDHVCGVMFGPYFSTVGIGDCGSVGIGDCGSVVLSLVLLVSNVFGMKLMLSY